VAKKERILSRGCPCGAVQYKVRDTFRCPMNCHCSQCRRATGSAFKPFGGIERDKFTDAPHLCRVEGAALRDHRQPAPT
jgi:hypothetical protein